MELGICQMSANGGVYLVCHPKAPWDVFNYVGICPEMGVGSQKLVGGDGQQRAHGIPR